MRIANCKWFVWFAPCRAVRAHSKCCHILVHMAVECDCVYVCVWVTLYLYKEEKQFSFNFTASSSSSKTSAKIVILKFVLGFFQFHRKQPTPRDVAAMLWQLCPSSLSLSRCRAVCGQGVRVGGVCFWACLVPFPFAQMCVQNFYEYCCVRFASTHSLWATALTPFRSYSFFSFAHTHSFKHFMIFYLFSRFFGVFFV